MRRWTDGKDKWLTCFSNPGLAEVKIRAFHSIVQRSADGMPELIDAPAPRKRLCGVSRLSEMERTNASKLIEGSALIGPGLIDGATKALHPA